MISDDEAHQALAALEGFKHALSRAAHRFADDFDPCVRASDESMELRLAPIRNEAEISRRLTDMKLPFDQEQLLCSVLTLPPAALELLREILGLRDRQH